MAECENKKCKRWFHGVCENIPEKVFEKFQMEVHAL